MEFLKASRRKSLFSELLYIALNIALAVALFALVATGSVALAVVLVLISKWRILAVRIRYWWANVLANIVDITVSMGVVSLLYLAGTSEQLGLYLQVVITVLYALWLIVLKPRSSKRWITVQAATGLTVGSWSVFAAAHLVPTVVVVVLMYVIAYGAARHILVSREESQPSLLAMVFGLVIAEMSWVMYHWTVAYGADVFGDFKFPQGTILIALVGFLALRLYTLHSDGRSLRSADAILPVVFTIVLMIVLTVVFHAGAGII